MVIVISLTTFLVPAFANSSPSDDTCKSATVTYTKFQPNEQHIFLNPGASASFSASDQLDGFSGYKFRNTHVSMNAANSSFLKEISTDLYIETNNYLFGGTIGAWTPNLNFTLTNPTSQTQEVFLNIRNSYTHIAYAPDCISNGQHTITFTTDTAPADQFSVGWGFFGALVSLDLNGSRFDPYGVSSANNIKMEDVSTAAVFYSPMTSTPMILKVQETGIPNPTSPYIGAWVFKRNFITLNPHQEYIVDVPVLRGWTFAYGIIDANISLSLYPQPYPFKLVNLAVYEPDGVPLLATPTNTTFGISNLSDQAYALYFDTTLYYWQNQTSAITYTDQVNVTDTQVYHNLSVNVPDATVGSDVGLSGQYVAFRSVGKILSYSAPAAVGRYQGQFMPLKSGTYDLVTVDPRIVQTSTVSVDNFGLKATVNISVTQDANPVPNANVTVHQKGTFTDRTYTANTNQYGQATITAAANMPEADQFTVTVANDAYNTAELVLNASVGMIWIVIVLAVVIIIVVFIVLLRKRKKQPKAVSA